MVVNYIGDYAPISPTVSAQHARTCDFNTYADRGDTIKLWDAVVTMLYNISEDTLSQFLDNSKN